MDQLSIPDKEKNRHIDGFVKAHRKAAHRYCKANGIEEKQIHAFTEENSESICYEYQGKVFLTATLQYIPKVKLKFKSQ